MPLLLVAGYKGLVLLKAHKPRYQLPILYYPNIEPFMNTATLFTPNLESQPDIAASDNEAEAMQSASWKKLQKKLRRQVSAAIQDFK